MAARLPLALRLALENLLFTLLVPGTVAVYVPSLLTYPLDPGAAAIGLSLPLFLAGALAYFWCLWDFAAFGRGTPAPVDAPRRLVVRGLYRFTRNPMYLAVLAVIGGWLVLAPGLPMALYLVAVAAAFHAFVALFEEPRLRALFGAEYEAYAARVGRWLPRRRPR